MENPRSGLWQNKSKALAKGFIQQMSVNVQIK